VQSSSQIITTNKPTSSFFTGRMPFLSPNQHCQSTEGKRNYKLFFAFFAETTNYEKESKEKLISYITEICLILEYWS